MKEQFIMVKHGASFQVHRNGEHLTIEMVQPGLLYPFICQSVASAQRSIAQFYLVEQKWKGNSNCSLRTFFSGKGWLIQEEEKAKSNAAGLSSALPK